jgi:aspartyl-tRNA(Asn)/glutamyl-tRNA(Gln) amidotransferase subunit A
MLQAMAGLSGTSTSVDQPVDDYLATLNQPLNGLRIGLPKEYFGQPRRAYRRRMAAVMCL